MSKFVIKQWKLIGIILCVFFVVACDPSEPEVTNTPDADRAVAAQTVLAGPTDTPRPIASPTPRTEIEQQLARTVFRMTQAVRDGDVEAYLDNVWQDDPIFMREQTRWIEGIANSPLNEFDINLTNITEVNDSLAYGRMSMSWRNSGASRSGMSGGSIMTVKFHKVAGEDEQWLFGGEAWEVIRLYLEGGEWTVVEVGDETPSDMLEVFRVHYFPDYGPLEGTKRETEQLVDELPTIYDYITETLDYAPENTIHIKVYDWRDTLRSMTDITLTQFYDRWVQPTESVKVSVNENSPIPVDPGIVTAEVTKMVLYQMAGNDGDRLPWWVLEGTGELIRSEHYLRVTDYNNIVEGVVALANVDFQVDPNATSLQDWDTLEDLDSIPLSIIGVATSQSHIFIRFISDEYGQDMRNEWIREMVAGQSVDEATESIYGKSLDDLTAEWQDWLDNQ